MVYEEFVKKWGSILSCAGNCNYDEESDSLCSVANGQHVISFDEYMQYIDAYCKVYGVSDAYFVREIRIK